MGELVEDDKKKLDWFSKSITGIMSVVCLLTFTFLGLSWYNATHYTYLGTYNTEYVGKYTSLEPSSGKLGSSDTVYNAVFKKYDAGTKTMDLIRVTVPFKFYNSTDSIDGLLTMLFYETKREGTRIGWEEGYLSVFDYDPSKSLGSATLVDAIFIDALYSPAPL